MKKKRRHPLTMQRRPVRVLLMMLTENIFFRKSAVTEGMTIEICPKPQKDEG
jgi:hypothetical protein